MKILNLYAGIGGNRKLWGNEHQITAVEYDPKIAAIYKNFWPNDAVVVGDAHQYLLEHFTEFDYIWASPPCPTHSRARYALANGTDFEKHPSVQRPTFPDMKLYEEILFLQGYFKGKWCVENVLSWYKPLIPPHEINKHYFWTNYFIRSLPTTQRGQDAGNKKLEIIKGFDLSPYKEIDKRKILRNCVEPETGLWVFQEAFKQKPSLF